MYFPRVLATQLSPELTKNLVLTDPYSLKSTAESVLVPFHIPFGVQLQVVYIPAKEHRSLSLDSQRAQTVKNQSAAAILSNAIPFQLKKKIKRDKSIIFTNIPEESATIDADPNASFGEIAIGTEALFATVAKPTAPRPTHLPLRFKNITSKDLPESGFSSINFDESDSFPQFIGRTSVCSTPITEMKVLHGAVLSICANNEQLQQIEATADKTKTQKESLAKPPEQIPQFKLTTTDFIASPYRSNEHRRHSLSSLQDSLQKIRITLRPFGHGLARLRRSKSPNNCCAPTGTDDDSEFDDIDRKMYRTITDPTYPVFNSAGEPISKGLFLEFLNRHHFERNDTYDATPPPINDFDSDMKTSPIHEQKKMGDLTSSSVVTPSTALNRISLSLPLKSLTTEMTTAATTADQLSSVANIFEVPAHRKKMAGIQLTPLMTKLSLLSEERSSGFSSWDTTPGGPVPQIEMGTNTPNDTSFRRRSSMKMDDVIDGPTSSDGELTRCQLFICGQQNMTMLLLMENGAGEKQDVIQAMVCPFFPLYL